MNGPQDSICLSNDWYIEIAIEDGVAVVRLFVIERKMDGTIFKEVGVYVRVSKHFSGPTLRELSSCTDSQLVMTVILVYVVKYICHDCMCICD